MVCYKKILQEAWAHQLAKWELAAYRGLSSAYFAQGNLQKGAFYKDRVQKGQLEPDQSPLKRITRTLHSRKLKARQQVSRASVFMHEFLESQDEESAALAFIQNFPEMEKRIKALNEDNTFDPPGLSIKVRDREFGKKKLRLHHPHLSKIKAQIQSPSQSQLEIWLQRQNKESDNPIPQNPILISFNKTSIEVERRLNNKVNDPTCQVKCETIDHEHHAHYKDDDINWNFEPIKEKDPNPYSVANLRS